YIFSPVKGGLARGRGGSGCGVRGGAGCGGDFLDPDRTDRIIFIPMRFVSYLRVLVITGLVVASRCGYQFGPPVISGVEGKGQVAVLDTCSFVCRVEPGARGPLSYEWWCSAGVFGNQFDNRIQWRAPESSGVVLLKVQVADGLDRKGSDSVLVRVVPRVVNFAVWEGAVRAGEAVWFFDSCPAGYRLQGQCSSDTTTIYLMFLDEPNFRRWQANESYQPRIRRLAYQAGLFYDTIPAAGLYFLVLDNRQGLRDCGYRINVQLKSP
ncbi:MAG: hypothetical protein ABIJ93_06070, partial [candidate division WOR-3 bacterium]